jgi:hypothetical protein
MIIVVALSGTMKQYFFPYFLAVHEINVKSLSRKDKMPNNAR